MSASEYKATGVLGEIAGERRRQVEAEGFDLEHDDTHVMGQMARAAACYAMFATVSNAQRRSADLTLAVYVKTLWPWAREWWKPKDRRRDLIRAAALIVAEIERLDRLKGDRDHGLS